MTNSVVLRRRDEKDAQFARREFNHCMEQVRHYHDLQFERRRMGWFGTAIFYQSQAARWYKLAIECRARYDATIDVMIPGTAVRWNDVFPPPDDDGWDAIRSIIEQNIKQIKSVMNSTLRDQADDLVFRSTNVVNRSIVMQSKYQDQPTRNRHGKRITPAQKYNDPRDVPFDLTDQMRDLIDGISNKRQLDHEPRCDCGHLFEICDYPRCPNGED